MAQAHDPRSDGGAVPAVRRVVLVGAFRSLIPEGADGPFGSQGGFVDTLAPAPYSLANAYLKAFAESDPEVSSRFRIDLLNLSEPIDIEDDREEVVLSRADLDRILSFEPDIVAFSTYCWNIDAVASAVAWLREQRPNLRIVLGGRGTEGEAAGLLAMIPGVDALVVGEGELAFREMLRRDMRELHTIPGVIARVGEKIASGGPSAPVMELDSIPSPFQLGSLDPPLHGVMMELSRGCLHACGYCTWNANKRLRHFGPARIEADVRWALQAGHRHITVTDSALNYDTDWLRTAIDAIRRADPEGQIQFTYNIRHDCVTDEQLALLSKLPTHMVLLGIETLSAPAMAAVDRSPVDVPALRALLGAISRAIRQPVVSIVLGLPGDTEQGFRETLETLLAWTQPDQNGLQAAGTVLVSLLQVYRGSKLWERREELGLRFMERGIPYLLESPSWPADALARAKALLVSRIAEHPETLKAAEAIVLMESRGGLSPWFSRARLVTLLRDWPPGASHEGWTFQKLGVVRDTGRVVVMRFSHADGGSVRVRLQRSDRHPSARYALSACETAAGSPPQAAKRRLDRLLQAVLARGEQRLVLALAEQERREAALRKS
jgi:radical SAM superfamily enzyme YgiQ (UPF0313 family)